MGLLDDVMGMASSALGNGAAANNPLLAHATELLNHNQFGGLAGLVQAFHDKGLGSLVSSWVGTGANLPISAEQIQSVLGNEQLQALATRAGLPVSVVQQALAAALPHAIDAATPNGTLPSTP